MPRRPPKPASPVREALIDEAERLFAESGVDAVSLRSINEAAGASSAALHYHFGSRDGLLEAVLLRRGEDVRAEIMQRAEKLLASEETPSVRDLVETLALPHVHAIERDVVRGLRYNRIVAELSIRDDPRLGALAAEVDPVLESLRDRVLADLPPDERAIRWYIAATAIVNQLAQLRAPQVAKLTGEHDGISRRYVATLIDMVVRGLSPD